MHAAVDGFVHFANAAAFAGQPQLVDDRPNPGQRKCWSRPPPKRAPRKPHRPMHSSTSASNWALAARQHDLDGKLVSRPHDRDAGAAARKTHALLHGHFTSSYQKGIPAAAMIAQNNLFRANALGNIRELTLNVSQDPAMLRYLDNAQNVKAHRTRTTPRIDGALHARNRQLQRNRRARIGPRLHRLVDRPRLRLPRFPARHDDGSKTFLGKTGNFTGHDIVEIIFAQPAAARWFARKLLAYFVYSDPEPQLIDMVAALIRKNDFNLQPVMSTVLRSNLFFSDRAYRALVKSPVQFIVGSYQLFGVPKSDLAALGALRRMGQILFYPPNVKGWTAARPGSTAKRCSRARTLPPA